MIDHVCTAVTVTYGESGRMFATYDAGVNEPKGRARVNGYLRNTAEAAAEAAVAAVRDWAEKSDRNEMEWANLDSAVVGRIGRNKFAVVFGGTRA